MLLILYNNINKNLWKFSSDEYNIFKMIEKYNSLPSYKIFIIQDQTERMENLSWPVTYAYYKFQGHDYFLFGDVHVTNHPCPNSSAFIDVNGNKKNVYSRTWDFNYFLIKLFEKCESEKIECDFFAEETFNISLDEKYRNPKNINKNYMRQVSNTPQIKNLYERKSNWQFIRAHYTNIRRYHYIKKDTDIIIIRWNPLIGLVNNKIDMLIEKQEKYAENVKKLIKEIKFIFETKLHIQYLDILFNSDNYNNDTQKLFLTLGYSGVGELFMTHPIRKQYLKLYQKNIIHNSQNLADLVKKSIYDFYENFDIMKVIKNEQFIKSKYYKHFSGILMDAYLLLRLFRNFNPKNPKQIKITYTGDRHTRFYRQFFEKYLNCKTLSYYDTKEQTGERIQCLQNIKLYDILFF